MGSRKSYQQEMANRAEAVGWEVDRSSADGVRVVMPPCMHATCPHSTVLHRTPGDIESENVVRRFFRSHGLEEAEAKVAQKRKLRASAANERMRMAAEKKAAAMAANARSVAIAKAAGPYAPPEYVENAWFAGEHPAPWSRWVIITPEQAQWIVNNLNTGNRPLLPETVDRYAGIIASKQWRQTHQGMAIDTNNVLQDGQHRLHAVAKADLEVPVLFSVGMDPDNFKALDEGLIRTAAQLLARDGVKDPRASAALVKLIRTFDGGKRVAIRVRRTNAEIYDTYQDGDERYAESIVAGRRYHQNADLRSAMPAIGALAAAHYLITRANGDDNPYVHAFFRGFSKGRKLDKRMALEEKDPRIKLRNYLANTRRDRKRLTVLDQVCLTILAWNHVLDGRRVSNMRLAPDMVIPRISEIGPDSICPELLEGEVDELRAKLAVVA